MELYIIRHGQSANNALEDHVQRVHDPELTDLGKQQVQRVAEFLAHAESRDPFVNPTTGFSRRNGIMGAGITHLYCSPMQRALQTAAPIATALGIAPEVWIDIHEHGGIYLDQPEGTPVGMPGRTRAEILADFPNYILPEVITEEGWYNAAQGYENLSLAYGRAIKVAVELRRRASRPEAQDERIALVSHGTFIDALLKALFNQLPARQLYYLHYNTAITRLDFSSDHLVVRYINRVDHLPPEMIS